MRVWLNGVSSAREAARIDPSDRGFLLGDGVFETILVRDGEIRHLARHLARLRDGASVLGIVLGWSDAEIAAAAGEVLTDAASAVLRITLSRGPGPRGVLPVPGGRPTLLITTGELPPPPGPARAVVARGTRRNEHSPLSRIKSLNYLDSILARQEAVAAGADEAILLNTAGDVAEASAGNLFVLMGEDWVTPRVADGALPGIARARLLEMGLAREARVSEADLGEAQAGFVSSSLGLRTVKAIGVRVLEERKVESASF